MITARIVVAALLSLLLAATAVNAAYSQFSGATGAFQQEQQRPIPQQQNQQRSESAPPLSSSSPLPSYFESPEKGIRFQVPPGYVVEDPELLAPEVQQLLNLTGIDLMIPQFLLHVCPDDLALSMIDGRYKCQDPLGTVYGPREGTGVIGSADAIHVMRFNNLHNNPEFEGVASQNRSISADDLIAFNIKWLEERRGVEIDVLNTANTTVNYYYPEVAINSTTANQASVALLPAKFADFVYTIRWNDGSSENSIEYRGYLLHVLGPDGNTGYILAYEQPSEEVSLSDERRSWITPAVAQVFESFELVGQQ